MLKAFLGIFDFHLFGFELFSWFATTIISIAVLFGFSKLATYYPKTFIRTNFLGSKIPVVGGFPLIAFSIYLFCLFVFNRRDFPPNMFGLSSFAVAPLGFGILGLIDDLFGDRSVGGFRGHFGALITKGRITTGLIKVLGGGFFALYLSYQIMLSRPDIHSYISVFVIGLMIALSANTFNLIDLRPGRTTLTGIFLTVVIFIVGGNAFESCSLAFAAIPIHHADREGRVMLGDCGSNAFGGAVGVLYTLTLPFWGVCVAVVLLLAFTIWTEKHSVNKLIEDTPWLCAIDRKIGVR